MFDHGAILDGKYRVLRLIGEGGMGAVFEAEATRLHRRVAVKVMRPELNQDLEIAARFQLEAQAAGRIGSRHIVDVLDLGQLPSGAPYMVMEFLDGESLRARIERAGPMSPPEILDVALQLLEGVAAAHAAGIIHRDLKPDNVFLVKQSNGTTFVKILDFGISKFKDAGGSPNFAVTRTGALMGTPHYLAPEQASGASAVDPRTDLYAAGVILYECLTGALPYAAESFNELLFKIVLTPPIPVSERVPNADLGLVMLIERALQKQPHLRFQTAGDMKLALEAWSRGTSFVAPEGVAVERQPSGHLANGEWPANPLTPSGSRLQSTPTIADLNAPRTLESWSRGGSGALQSTPIARPNPRRALGLLASLLVVSCLLAALLWRSSNTVSVKELASSSTTPLAMASVSGARAGAPPPEQPAAAPPPNLDRDLVEPPANSALTSKPIASKPADRPSEPSRRTLGTPRAPAAARPRIDRAPATPIAAPVSPSAASSPGDTDVIRTGKGRPIRGDL
jgi:eukaryotic-like serine/threonine-protein kinase